MPRVFLGNFDFEHELASGVSGGPQGSDFFWAWLPVAEAQDFIITPGRIAPRDFTGLTDLGLALPRFVHAPSDLEALPQVELVPWGWTKSVINFGRSRGLQCAASPWDVVRQINSRAFRFELEREWNIGLPGAAMVASLKELDAILRLYGTVPRGWLLKANFGMSGREALRGRGTTLDDKTRNWAQMRLADNGPLVFEPMVDRIGEAGIQIEIPQAGPPQLMGITPLLADRSGVYRGSRFGCPARELEAWQPAVGVGLRVAQTLQGLGYFGPLGIDAMQYRDDKGEIHLRLLQDLNARYTMGRLALGFRRLLPAGGCGSWLHFSRRHLAEREWDDWFGNLRNSMPADTVIAVTSPQRIESRPAEHHAAVILTNAGESRRQAESALFGSLGMTVGGGGLRPEPKR